MKRFFVFLLIAGTFSSCVPLSDLIYIRNKDKSKKEGAVITPIALKPYRFQSYDNLTINITALDEKFAAMFQPGQANMQMNMQMGGDMSNPPNGFRIDERGNIRMPIIGEMNVLGLTADEVRFKIEKELLDKYFKKEADVFVTVRLSGIRYTMNGEIGAVGIKTVMQERLTILEAIANSGDITITGDRKNVSILRQFPYGTELHDIDLTDINVMNSPYYYVQPNDYIYVKPLAVKTWGTGTTGIQSLGTIITLLSVATTTYLLLNRN